MKDVKETVRGVLDSFFIAEPTTEECDHPFLGVVDDDDKNILATAITKALETNENKN